MSKEWLPAFVQHQPKLTSTIIGRLVFLEDPIARGWIIIEAN
jgi:hypothetical protein